MPSVGLDLVEIGRVQKAMKRSRFCRKILGGEEYRQLEKRGFPPQSVAASFSAKEAFSKAIGTGVRGFSLGIAAPRKRKALFTLTREGKDDSGESRVYGFLR